MPSLRDCIGKVGKRLSPADAEAMHARAKQYLADGHPVEKAEKMAVDFSIGEAQKQIDSIYKQAGVKRGAKAATAPVLAATPKEAVKIPEPKTVPTAQRETVTPSEDTPVGKNDAGEILYERKDGSRYRMRKDRKDRPSGYPDFGGDLSPVVAKETSPAIAPAPVETPKGQEVTPTAAQERNIAKLADKKQLRVQKEYLVDAVKKAREEAPDRDAPIVDAEGKTALKLMEDVRKSYDATREKLKSADGEAHNINEADAKEKLSPLVEKYTDLHDLPASTQTNADGTEQVLPAQPWRNLNLSSIEAILENAIRNRHGEHVRIEVPGDGTFRVPNTKLHLEKFAEMAAKRFGKGVAPLAPGPYKATSPTPIPSVKKSPKADDITESVGRSKSDDETRKVLFNVVQDGKWTVATDGRRLTVAIGGAGLKLGKDRTFKIGKETESYPNWRQVIPKDIVELTDAGIKVHPRVAAKINTEVNTADLLKLVIIAKTATSEKANSIKIVQLDDGTIGLAAASPDFGSYKSEGVPDSEDMDATSRITAINPDFLIDSLTQAREMGAEKVRIIAKDEVSPIVITDGKTFANITMPVRLSSLTDEAASAIVAREKEGREVIARWQAANPKAPKTVTIVNDPKWMENGRGVKGQFADGKLTINLAYAPDEASIVDTANHEWAHDTLSSNEGRMAIATFATRELPAADLSDLARKYPKQSGESTVDHRIRLAEEWVAKNAEKNPAAWQRIVESIKAWLQRHGMTTLTNEEAARALLRALRVNLPSGPRGGARSSVGERTDTPAFRAWFGKSKVVNPDGSPKRMYHGSKQIIDEFKARFDDGLLFFSSNPDFASRWAENRDSANRNFTKEDFDKAHEAENKWWKDNVSVSPTGDLLRKGTDTPLSEAEQDAFWKERRERSPFRMRDSSDAAVYPVYIRAEKIFDPRKDFRLVEPLLRKMPSMDGVLKSDLHKTGAWAVYENKEVTDYLRSKGYDAMWLQESSVNDDASMHTLAVFSPTQVKSATGNRGTFDPNNPDIRYSVGDEGPSLGIKNAAVEQQRSDWNLPPPKERHGMAYEEARSEAKARFDADPFVGQKLVEELSANPRAPTGVENLILDHELVRLHNERNAAEKQFGDAAKSKDAAQMALAEARINAARDAFERTMDVADAVGTKSSESLYLRKAMLKEDYSLAALERKMKQANGGEDLTKAQEEEVRKVHEKYQATLKNLEAKLAQVETERAKAVLDVELLKIIKGVSAEPKAQRNREADDKYFETQAQAAEKRLAGKKAFDPADLNSYAIYAANLLHKKQPKTMAKSALTDETISSYPPEFEQEMIAKFGESVRPHLKDIYQRALVATPLIESQVPGTRNVKGERKTTKEKIKDRIEEGDNVEDLGIYVQKLAEQFVREGITEREALVTAVHKELNGLGLEISRRDTMDAISGYGKFKPLDQDEVKATLRDLKGQMQQVGKLEDMAAGQAPAKTGVERRTPTDEERRLIQQVEEAKRKGGFNVTDPVKQLKTALDAIKTRLKNSIADLDYQIATGQQTVKEKTGTPYDAEATALRERRNELKKQYDEIFGQSELTDEQRIAMAEKAADSQIAELERQLRTNEVFAKQQAQPLNSPALEAKRARIAALKEERYYARQLLQPRADPKTRDEIALQAYKTATAKRIAELQERLARGDFAPRAKPPERVLDTEALRLKALHEKVKTEFHEALIHERMKRRTTGQKVFDTGKEIINLPRTVMSSGDVSAVLRQGAFIAFGNPARAARSIGPMFKALGSEEQSSIIEQEILNRPNASRYKQHKLYIAPHNVLTLAAMEEQIMSRLAKYIPGVKASNRAYITFLNKLRADSFDAMYEAMTPEQQKNPKNVDAIASFINVATGRGDLGKASGMAENLATVFFSPRLLASRFQLLAGTPAMRGDKETRKMIRKEYVKFLTGLAVILGLGAMAGADIEKDSRSTDFLKLRFGNTRLDVLGGLGQVTTLVTRLLTGETKNAKGEIKPIRGNVDYGATDSIKVMTNFIRSKLSPSIGAAVNIARGETMTGQEVTPTNQTMSLAMPLSFQDIGEAFQAQGPAAGTALAALSLFGFGLQQYGADIEGIAPDLRRTLNDAGLSAPNPDRPQVGPPNKKRWASDAEYARYQKEVSERFTTLMTGRKAMLAQQPRDKAQELVTKMMEISRKSAHDRLDRYAR